VQTKFTYKYVNFDDFYFNICFYNCKFDIIKSVNNRGEIMQVSQTYNYDMNDDVNRANMALICSQYLGIKEVSPSLYQIAAPVSELSRCSKDGGPIWARADIEEAIPWDERSMRTFGVVYRYESTASFIGMDGRTYIVPNDQPVLDHLSQCGYVIAPSGKNFDGTSNGDDSLIRKEDENGNPLWDWIDKNLPPEIVAAIDEMEQGRDYYRYHADYSGSVSWGGTFALHYATEEEIQQLSLTERKVANIKTYGRVHESQDLEDYVQYALQQPYLDEQKFRGQKRP